MAMNNINLRPSRRAVVAGIGTLGVMPAGQLLAATPPIEAKIVLEDQRLWVGATIGSSEPLLFIVDTGAGGNFIRPDIAKRLKLTDVGGSIVGGVGGRSANTKRMMGHDVLIGGAVRQRDMLFDTYDLSVGFPGDTAGLFAAGLFTAYDTDLDFVGGKWRLWPKGRDGVPKGVRLADSSIAHGGRSSDSERIYVTAQIDGQAYRLMVDTGAPSSILLFPRAAARSGLFEGRAYAPHIIGGFGGYSRKLGRRVRATKLELGPLALKRPFVTVMDPKDALSLGFDGLVGLPIISLFDIATEASAGKLWLARNSLKPTADPYARGGIWFARKGTETIVSEIGKGSPAEAAGVRLGDVLVAPKDFGQAIKQINGEAGREVVMSFRRDGVVIERKFVLADYL